MRQHNTTQHNTNNTNQRNKKKHLEKKRYNFPPFPPPHLFSRIIHDWKVGCTLPGICNAEGRLYTYHWYHLQPVPSAFLLPFLPLPFFPSLSSLPFLPPTLLDLPSRASNNIQRKGYRDIGI